MRWPAAVATLLTLLLLGSPAADASEASGALHTLRGAHTGATGGGFGSLGQAGVGLSVGALSGARLGFWAIALPDLQLELELLGTAQGGSVSLTVAGMPLVVATEAGQSASEVAQEIAAAIEADAVLSALGVRAVAVGGAVFTNGGTTMVVIADAGLGQPGLIPSAPAWALALLGGLLLGLAARHRGLRVALALLVLGLFPGGAAGVPLEVSYQGQLLDSGGLPLTGTVTLELRIWNDASSTNPDDLVYEETHAAVSVVAGVFSVALGGGTVSVGTFDAGLLAAPALWLETEVDGDVLAPRERLLAVPYAISAGQAESVGSLDSLFVEHYFEQGNFDNSGPNNTDPQEGVADPDGDGLLNFLDSDNDNDGISDSGELSAGSDLNLITPTLSAVFFPGWSPTDATLTVSASGTNFEAGMTVAFGSESPVPMSMTATTFDVQVGPQPAGFKNVTVTRLNGESASQTFPFHAGRYMFVSSAVYDGDLGGLAGADTECQSLATAAGLPGTYLAWLADGTASPATRFVQNPDPYRRVDASGVIANGWADLTDTLISPVTVTELGVSLTAADLPRNVWTNVAADGTERTPGRDCLGWTSSSSGDIGVIGNFLSGGLSWTEHDVRTCDQSLRLYCVHQ